MFTYFKNCGKIDVHPLRSCLSVKYNSNVDTVLGSVFNEAIRLKRFEIKNMLMLVIATIKFNQKLNYGQ